MRFAKWPKPTAYVETSRKRAAFVTKQRREREALPLFADMIAAGQHSVDEEMARRTLWWPSTTHQPPKGAALCRTNITNMYRRLSYPRTA